MMPSPQPRVRMAPRRRSLSSAEMYAASLQPPKVSRTNTTASAIPPPDAFAPAPATRAAGSARTSPATMTASSPSTSSAVSAYCTPPLWRRPATLSSVSATTTPAATTAERPGRGSGAVRQRGDVVAHQEREDGDGSGLDHRHPRPGAQKPGPAAEGPAQEVVLAARVGVRGRQLGVAERADQGDRPADHPETEEHRPGRAAPGHQLGRPEDPRAQHQSDHEDDPVAGVQDRPRRGSLARALARSPISAPPCRDRGPEPSGWPRYCKRAGRQ